MKSHAHVAGERPRVHLKLGGGGVWVGKAIEINGSTPVNDSTRSALARVTFRWLAPDPHARQRSRVLPPIKSTFWGVFEAKGPSAGRAQAASIVKTKNTTFQ